MAKEIERKFLVKVDKLPDEVHQNGAKFTQGYFVSNPTTRVRLSNSGTSHAQAWLTIKGSGLRTRSEFEYEIPVDDAEELLEMCATKLSKTRHKLVVGRHLWEIDEFSGAHSGLWLAEVELDAENETFTMPDWLGEEVTEDSRFTNAALAKLGRLPT